MERQDYWVSEGRFVPRPVDGHGQNYTDRALLQQRQFVKVELDVAGAVILWDMSGGNWASLFLIKDWISPFDCPVKLRFFNSGWFEESYLDPAVAKNRIEQLIFKSDVRLSSRVFTRDFRGSSTAVAAELMGLIEAGAPDESKAVMCTVNADTGRVDVRHVGKSSVLAGIWGEAPMSYPCQTGHSYDKIVSKNYHVAIAENRPVYDQVLASMVKPNGDTQWIGYHRVIFPKLDRRTNHHHVLINCALSEVDIPLL